jgi:hypothetical protein
MMNVARYENVVTHVNATLVAHPHWLAALNEYRVQAAWRMGVYVYLALLRSRSIAFLVMAGLGTTYPLAGVGWISCPTAWHP